jgi:hypothetical protein
MPMAADWLLTVATTTAKMAAGIVIEAIHHRWPHKPQVDRFTIPTVPQRARLELRLLGGGSRDMEHILTGTGMGLVVSDGYPANESCTLHGGASTGAPKGNRNAWKHGARSGEALAASRLLRVLAQAAGDL